MQRHTSDEDEPLDDKTAALALHSKRTERMQRKQAKRDKKRQEKASFVRLPTELILEILKYLRPSEVFEASFVNQRLRSIVHANSDVIGDQVIKRRYSILARCFPLPIFLSKVDPSIQPLLTNPSIHNRPYQHLQPPDPHLLCTCLTCNLTWNNLGLVLDFAHWQNHLDSGEPIPILPRGKKMLWNEELVDKNARTVRKALDSSLWHARILEIHLESTIRSAKRHQKNKGNKRKHISMSKQEAATGTDEFLQKPGPISLEFPFNRDEYYMLEAYLPNRWLKKFEQQWIYTIAGQHEKDLEFLARAKR